MVLRRAYTWHAPDICMSECTLPATITAGADNRSNPQALEKGSSMKWPLMGLMLQFASCLASCGGRIKLQWRPREENIEADESIFDSLQDAQAEFAELKAAQKLHTQKTVPTSKKQRSSWRRLHGSIPFLSSLTPRLRTGGFVWLVMSP